MRAPIGHNLALAVFALSLVAGAAPASDNSIAHMQDETNKHFDEASKDFGGGAVQMHARKEGADGTTHVIYQFDCTQQNYDVLFSGLAGPDSFPLDAWAPAGTPIDQNDDIAPLAQHACTKHGYPLLKW